MIGKLTGVVDSFGDDWVILDVNGVGYVAQCSVRGITLESLEIETEGDIDLRGFLGLDASVPAGYKDLKYTVRIKGDGTPEQFEEVHAAVMATSPNFYNIANAITLKPTLVVA